MVSKCYIVLAKVENYATIDIIATIRSATIYLAHEMV